MSEADRKKGSLSPSYEERVLRRIPWEILALSFLTALVCLILFEPFTALFVLSGGVLASLSFIWLKTSLSKFLVPEKKKALKSGLALYSLRLLLLLSLFFIIIIFFSEKIIAFAAGFSTIILVLMVEAFIGLIELKKWKS
jgi:hypothetical protein